MTVNTRSPYGPDDIATDRRTNYWRGFRAALCITVPLLALSLHLTHQCIGLLIN